MAVQQHGISRSRHRPRPVLLTGHGEHDSRALADAQGLLTQHLDETENRLAKRLNEMLLSGTIAQRPAAGVADRIYWITDQEQLSFDDGTAWKTGTGAATQQVAMTPDAPTSTIVVSEASASYVPTFTTTWFTMIRVLTQTATQLVVEFSNPPQAGDVLSVVIQ